MHEHFPASVVLFPSKVVVVADGANRREAGQGCDRIMDDLMIDSGVLARELHGIPVGLPFFGVHG